MKYYILPSGVKGWVPKLNKWMLFATMEDYIEYVED